MKDLELNEVLKRAAVPERGADYWERFPGQVTAELERRRQQSHAQKSADAPAAKVAQGSTAWTRVSPFRWLGTKPAFAIGVAAICLALGFVLGSWNGHRTSGTDPQFAEARKYFHELEGLFPNQLQAIVFDQQGTHLVLAQKANLPASPPLYLKICGPDKGCRRFVTFSGQQIEVNGELCDVLADGQGKVLLVGHQFLWSGSRAGATSAHYQVDARPLENSL